MLGSAIQFSHKSFIYRENRTGPNTDPWAIPLRASDQVEIESLTTTVLFVRNCIEPRLFLW